MAGYEELKVWQRARALVVEIYRISATDPFTRDRALRSQIRRAAVSIPSNIAEGHQRKYRREFARFLTIALGSCGEVRTQLQIAASLSYIETRVASGQLDAFSRLAASINALRVTVLRQTDSSDPG